MSEVPDKGYLYGVYQRSQDWKESLHKKLAHKSLDIGMDDDVNVDNSRTATGMGWKELAVIAATGIGGMVAYQSMQKDATPPAVVQPAPMQPIQSLPPLIDSEYEVRFFDRFGNPIDIPPISQRPQE